MNDHEMDEAEIDADAKLMAAALSSLIASNI